MDKQLLNICRYTGVTATPSKSGDLRMAVCPSCSGVTLVTLNGVDVLKENAYRCSYCGISVIDGLDFEVLNITITEANNLLKVAVEGTSIGEYAVGSKATLQTAINTASSITVKFNPVPTQAEINSAVTTLKDAITTFESGKVAA